MNESADWRNQEPAVVRDCVRLYSARTAAILDQIEEQHGVVVAQDAAAVILLSRRSLLERRQRPMSVIIEWFCFEHPDVIPLLEEAFHAFLADQC